MWIKTYSKYFENVDPKIIWDIWSDVENWPTWHDDFDYCKLLGAFKEGDFYILKPKGSFEVKICIVKIDDGKGFADCTKFFGAKMYDTHSLVVKGDGVVLENKLEVTGPLKFLWIKLVAKGVAESIAKKSEALVKLARKKKNQSQETNSLSD